MFPRETVNWLVNFVYKGGLPTTKCHLSERAKSGDAVARKLLNAIGLYEQGQASQPGNFPELSLREMAGAVRCAAEHDANGLMQLQADFLVGRVIEHDLPVPAAVATLCEGDF